MRLMQSFGTKQYETFFRMGPIFEPTPKKGGIPWEAVREWLFFAISASGSDFNPQNTQCMSACPVGPVDRSGVLKIFVFLELEQN